MTTPSRLILASGSPRRQELLAHLDLPFEVQPSQVDEEAIEARVLAQQAGPPEVAQALATAKALAVAQQHPTASVLGMDTLVALGREILNKPKDLSENRDFLRRLSGRQHQVYSGVCLITPTDPPASLPQPVQRHTQVACTSVTFRLLTEAEINSYTQTGEGLDKAGGYGIQGRGMALVQHIDGEYSNVVGLPLSVVMALLRQAGWLVWGA